MTTRLKTRSDYHVFNANPDEAHLFSLNSWLKPLFWLVLGAILGMSYNKRMVDSCYDMLAFNQTQKETIVAASAPHPSTHATARGNTASKA